ncbi:MAG: NnrS family protein [Nitrospirae bacterium]|nr:MAG: NnrS family protein [Nitrospirota bacterium]
MTVQLGTADRPRESRAVPAWLRLGFRPFFLSAAGFSVVAMAVWTAVWTFERPWLAVSVPATLWHAHVMLFGYTSAVIAGFLLTAVRNWTDLPTLRGTPLLAVWSVWLFARIAWFLPWEADALLPAMAAVCDLGFGFAICWALALPLVRTGQQAQLVIVAKVAVFVVANGLCYLTVLGFWEAGFDWGIRLGVYTVISLILVLGRRVIPMFIARGAGYPVQPKNYGWVDRLALPLFLAFVLADLFLGHPTVTAWLAGLLAIVYGCRLWGWHTPGIWRKPLLWVLYIGYSWVVAGFVLTCLGWWWPISPYLPLHAWTAGGIGVMTIGMMTRVTLGHTGRNVLDAPSGVGPLCGLIVASAFCRVMGPWLWPEREAVWIVLSQITWILAGLLFLWIAAPLLVRPSLESPDD